MSERYFQLRLRASYEGDENKIRDLQVEVLHDDQWELLQLDVRSPGFLLFINGLLSCQHLYMRTNAAERGIALDSAHGEMKIVTDAVWAIKTVDVRFEAKIKSGRLTPEAHAYIVERMHHCPVSTNLPQNLRPEIRVEFV